MPASMKHLTHAEVVQTILAKWEDGLYYPASVIKCSEKARQCLIRFDDEDVERWRDALDLHIQLTEEISEDFIVCCICDNDTSKTPNEILICDLCQQGYHVMCHTPPVDRETVDMDEDKEWYCSTCKYLTLPPKEQARLSSRPIPVTTMAKPTSRKSTPVKKVSAKAATSKIQPLEPKPAAPSKIQPPEPEPEPAEMASPKPPKKADVKAEVIKTERLKDNGQEGCIDFSLSKKKLKDGTTVEEMHPQLIEAAMTLAKKDAEITTKDFANLISSIHTDLPPPKKKKVVKKVVKTKVVAAAS